MAAKSIEELRSSHQKMNEEFTAKFEELDHKIVSQGESMRQMMIAFFEKVEQKLESALPPTAPAAAATPRAAALASMLQNWMRKSDNPTEAISQTPVVQGQQAGIRPPIYEGLLPLRVEQPEVSVEQIGACKVFDKMSQSILVEVREEMLPERAVFGQNELKNEAHKMVDVMSKPNLTEFTLPEPFPRDLEDQNVFENEADKVFDGMIKRTPTTAFLSLKAGNQLIDEVGQPYSLELERLKGTRHLLDEMRKPVRTACIVLLDEVKQPLSWSIESSKSGYLLFDEMPKIGNHLLDEVTQRHSLKPAGLKDSWHRFDELPKQISAERNEKMYATQSYISPIGYVLQPFDNGSSTLIDDGVILLFDPGGSCIFYKSCDPLELNSEEHEFDKFRGISFASDLAIQNLLGITKGYPIPLSVGVLNSLGSSMGFQFVKIEGMAVLGLMVTEKTIWPTVGLMVTEKTIWPTVEQLYGTSHGWSFFYNIAGSIEMICILNAVSYGPVLACKCENSTMMGIGALGIGHWGVFQACCWRISRNFLIRFEVRKAYYMLNLFVCISHLLKGGSSTPAGHFVTLSLCHVFACIKSWTRMVRPLNDHDWSLFASPQDVSIVPFYLSAKGKEVSDISDLCIATQSSKSPNTIDQEAVFIEQFSLLSNHIGLYVDMKQDEGILDKMVALHKWMVVGLVEISSKALWSSTELEVSRRKFNVFEYMATDEDDDYQVLYAREFQPFNGWIELMPMTGWIRLLFMRYELVCSLSPEDGMFQLAIFVWDPGPLAVFLHILEGKDGFEREGKRMICIEEGIGDNDNGMLWRYGNEGCLPKES